MTAAVAVTTLSFSVAATMVDGAGSTSAATLDTSARGLDGGSRQLTATHGVLADSVAVSRSASASASEGGIDVRVDVNVTVDGVPAGRGGSATPAPTGSAAEPSASGAPAAPKSTPGSGAAGSAQPTGGSGSTGAAGGTGAAKAGGTPAPGSPAPAATGAAKSAGTAAKGAAGNVSLSPGTWLSGAAGTGAADGAMGDWRGRPIEVAATWADNNEAMVEISQLGSGGEYGSWDKPLDVAIGGIGDGETWGSAAGGAYDARWRQSLTTLKELWGARTATVFLRFAHEMNGDWYDWSVNEGNYQAFIESWKRFRALQQEIFPAAQLVFCVNRESVGSGVDWRETFPGAEYVDVMGVDYYNQYPYIETASEWAESLDDTTDDGAPKGLQQHLDFARSVGLPLSLPEWSGIAHNGDSPAFIEGMYEFFSANAGSGPGQILYEVQFNVDMNDGDFQLFAGSGMPKSAEAYARLF